MANREKAISDLMNGISELLDSNFERCGLLDNKATMETQKDLKDILEGFGFEVEFAYPSQYKTICLE